MNCRKCGHEMLVSKLTSFWTEYDCPVCGRRQVIGAIIPDRRRHPRTRQRQPVAPSDRGTADRAEQLPLFGDGLPDGQEGR